MSNYNGIKKKKVRRVVQVTELSDEAECRICQGAWQLMNVMGGVKPESGKSYHILSGGKVDMLAHVPWLLVHYRNIRRLTVSSWAISADNICYLEKLARDGDVGWVRLIVGDVYSSSYKMEWEKVMNLYEEGVLGEVIKGAIHAKLLLLETEGGEKIVVEGSANCNMNPRIEQSCVSVSATLYDFYENYIREVRDQQDATTAKNVEIDETWKTDNPSGLTLFGEEYLG